ncbi:MULTISPECIES: DUF2207 domain-containing protein [Cryobacterium]|uniref:DUF2207 domain-containing protein n=1 Tax=Cryobacterium breve TaxID=1259258 RepID=A0ABY2J370_9MICO|nr:MULTISPECIES: DUF2207 domain-containing protein [Cryobacterium]TFC92749.1 DUF2207 domain-containing protein [Cryobacterium sp. TmT3-12]TFC99377.1 DUF2207 domain-containing protein [Cryobacterium breve]
MRRAVISLFTAILGGLAVLGLSVPSLAAAAPAAPPSIVSAGTDDFTFDSWHSEFELALTTDGHSRLTTTETIVARFPETDQNRGILRAIPTHYDGHPTDLELVSVTDENGRNRGIDTTTTSEDGGDEFLEVTIAADDYAHGAQTYVITYKQVDVALEPEDAPIQEFYREVNGTGWAQPFGDVSATLTVDPDVAPRLTGEAACYQGTSDSSETCASLSTDAAGEAVTIEITAGALGPAEGLTLAVGFEPGTFVPRDQSFTANPLPGIGLAAALFGLIVAGLAIVARATRWRNAPGRPTIIAEYLPPKGVNLLVAGNVTRTSGKAMTAQFLSFAVRGNVRVLEDEGKKHYMLELQHTRDLDTSEQAVLRLLFPGLHAGRSRDLTTKDTTLGTGLTKQLQAVLKQVLADGLRVEKGGRPRRWLIAGAVFTGILTLVGCVGAFITEVGGGWPVLVLVLGIAASVTTLTAVASVRPFTAAGAELRDYLAGVKLYIDTAEADRLRVLQSPVGALRSPYRPDPASVLGRPGLPDPGQPGQVLKLYERLLPFAVLFGQEKEWSRVLGEYYARSNAQPDWYAGNAPFNPVWFAAGLSSFTSSTSASWSGSASSSSS